MSIAQSLDAPGAAGPATQPFSARTVDGVDLSFRVAGRGAPMLIHNGLLSSIVHWRDWVAHFARSHAVITWDYPGHGESPNPRDASVIGIERFAAQGQAVLEAARVEAATLVEPGPAIVCGLSMGVQVALEHYRLRPDDVRALVLVCGTYGYPLNRVTRSPRFRRSVIAGVRAAGRSRALLRAALWPVVATPLGREVAFLTGGARRGDCPASLLDELFAHVHRLDPAVLIAAVASYLDHTAEDVLERVAAPTLIIAGGADQLTPPPLSERMHRWIASSEMHVVPGRSHLAQVEEPGTVHAIVENFVSRLRA